MQHKSLFAALLCGALCLTACLKNEESPSVTQVRNAKAEELLSIATLNKADAEATLIQAKADEKVKAAEAKLHEAEAKVREADAAYRLAEADKVKAETQLVLVNVQLQEIQVEIAKVRLESDKVELERQKALLLAQKAEYEAKIAQAELDKQEAEAKKQLIEKELEIALEQLRADLLEAQYNVVAAQKAYEDFLKDIEKQAKEAEIAEFEALRTEAIRLSAEYHAALRELLALEEALVNNQFHLSALENGLESAIAVKTQKILAYKRIIANNNIRIENLEKYKKEYIELYLGEGWGESDIYDINDQLAYFEGQLNDLRFAYEKAWKEFDEDASDAYDDAWDAYATVYPIDPKTGYGMMDSDYNNVGIVYDYTDALFNEDDVTGVDLSHLDNLSLEKVKAGEKAEYVSTDVYDVPSADGWHTVKMRVNRTEGMAVPHYDSAVNPNSSTEVVELYRYYKDIYTGEFGIKYSDYPQAYPKYGEGIAEDWSYESNDKLTVSLYDMEFVPMVVNKEGFDKYIAIRQEIVEVEKDYFDLFSEGADFIKNWYIENFEEIAKGVEKVKADAYDAYAKAYGDYSDKYKAYLDAQLAWAKKHELNYESWQPEQEKLQELITALNELKAYIDENKDDMAAIRLLIAAKEAEIATKQEEIDAVSNKDAQFKAGNDPDPVDPQDYQAALVMLKSHEVDLVTAQKAYDDANAELKTLKTKYDNAVANTAAKKADYQAKQIALSEAQADLARDPSNATLIAKKNEAETAMNTAKTAYETAQTDEGTAYDAWHLKDEDVQKMAVDYPYSDLWQANEDVTYWGNIVYKYTKVIEQLQKELVVLNGELDDLKADLKPYEDELKPYIDAVEALEADWNKIVTDAQNNEEWTAVENAKTALATSESDLEKAHTDYQTVYKYIHMGRYFNDGQYAYVTDDTVFPGWEDEILAHGLDKVRPTQAFSYWYDIINDFRYSESSWPNEYTYAKLQNLDETWTIINAFYKNLRPLSLSDFVYYYHQFADGDKFDLEIADVKAYWKESIDELQKEVNDIQARLDKVMAGEAVYNEGIKKANVAYAAYIIAYKNYIDKYNAVCDAWKAYTDLNDVYNRLAGHFAEGSDFEGLFSEIVELQAENAELQAYIDDWSDLYDDALAIEVLEQEIAIEESEIEDQAVIVDTWKKQLDEVMAKIKEYLPEAEEPAAEEEIPAE